MTVPRFLVNSDALAGTRAVLTDAELHHLHVRRLRVGSQLILSDGQGGQRHGTVISLDRHQAIIHLDTDQLAPRESSLRLVLAQALLKADKMDLVIEKATELGVSEVVVFDSERSLGQPSAERHTRWQRIARSAAKQCQRSTVPLVAAPQSFDTVLSRTEDLRLFFWEGPGGRHLATIADQRRTSEVLCVVGPEGGFDRREADRAAACGFHLSMLGPRVLRAETAAAAAATLCQFLWGDLG
jgi:16S rRNA (uracil1498-N3)-methyltransferase